MASDFGATTYPVAAKEYRRCEWCGTPIRKGEQHAKFTGRWEGEWQAWRMHADCLAENEDAISEGFEPYEGSRPPLHRRNRAWFLRK